ncbi:AcrR family transcriptional regulator [Novosphingobium chloroacetimidivorans]|uniref:AcrR family transcriptional regulator n=1 Tax=Novosphingobium chloroacetimidivorans TaxID=1428314 RepID=A0A7W7NW10_9SPHN|nr:TetR/AcrR family transcriptional regulator [Novosphingobium chloroacetimidivorans]MBB4857660.1 AcrR family transcriptional regulator [Novosphingobium chloroacetimidivorans]
MSASEDKEQSAAMSAPEVVPSRTRGRPSPEAAAQIDREILHAARDLFFAHGYESTSMAMIVKAAGVSKTTLYARYATKSDLFKASLDLTVSRIENGQLDTGRRRTRDIAGGLMAFGRHALMISRLPLWTNYERMALAEGLRFPELGQLVAHRIDTGIETVTAFITEAAPREGLVCDDPEAMATSYVMALRGHYTASVLRGKVSTVEECDHFLGKLVAMLIAGCTRKA